MQEQAHDDALSMDCWLGGAEALQDTCLIEREASGFVIRHPDGGFRRFGVDDNGSLQALDGFAVIEMGEQADGHVDVVVSGDRYRIPTELAQ